MAGCQLEEHGIFLVRVLTKHSLISSPQQPQLRLSLSPFLNENKDAVSEWDSE